MLNKHYPAVLGLSLIGAMTFAFDGPSANAQTRTQAAETQAEKHAESEGGQSLVTFYQDVAPIIWDRCSGCHRPEQVGPFPLLTYEQVSDRAQTILSVIEAQYMPPWKPTNNNLAFANDRRLTTRQVQLLEQWVKQGKQKGKEVTPPTFPEKWILGQPDLIVKMKGRFPVPAEGPDIYRSFVFPLDLPEDKWVKAVELRPAARSSVHHALFFVDTAQAARQQDGKDGVAGIKGMSFLAVGTEPPSAENRQSVSGGGWLNRLRNLSQASRPNNDRFGQLDRALSRGLGGYVPGAMPNLLPGDLALHLPAGSDVVMQTHFHPSGKPEVEEAELALYFADQAPTQLLVPVQVPAMFGFGAGINVPAGERHFVVEDEFQLPIDVRAVSVGGHAHYICREMSMVARLPNGEDLDLMKIIDWDLDWQDRYYFKEPIDLPAGTVLKTRLVYDNSEDNAENPHHPPQPIRWGRQSTDEMGSVTLHVISVQESERPQLENTLSAYFRETVVNRFRGGTGMLKLLKQLDSDGDGRLQRSEAPPMLGKNFSLFDVDRDGSLDPEELKNVAEVAARLGLGRRQEQKNLSEGNQ